jgi:hypothetical protein
MPTEKQIAANRRNSNKSTGPKSAEGKAAIRFNALRHGLTAENIVLSIEERPVFEQLHDEFLAEHRPATPTERLLVEQMVAAAWRLRRVRATETAYFDREMERLDNLAKSDYPQPGPWDRMAYVFRWDNTSSNTLALLARYEARLERSFYKALRELQRLRAQRPAAPAPSVTETKQEPESEIGFVCSNPVIVSPATEPAPSGSGPVASPHTEPRPDALARPAQATR